MTMNSHAADEGRASRYMYGTHAVTAAAGTEPGVPHEDVIMEPRTGTRRGRGGWGATVGVFGLFCAAWSLSSTDSNAWSLALCAAAAVASVGFSHGARVGGGIDQSSGASAQRTELREGGADGGVGGAGGVEETVRSEYALRAAARADELPADVDLEEDKDAYEVIVEQSQFLDFPRVREWLTAKGVNVKKATMEELSVSE